MRVIQVGLPIPAALREGVHTLYRQAFGGEPQAAFERSPGTGKTLFVALVGDEVVGFKFGAEKKSWVFHSRMGAVSPSHRRRGVARALLRAQHAWAETGGYTEIHSETLNAFRPMLILNLTEGFEVMGTRCSPQNEPMLLLQKQLGQADDVDAADQLPSEPSELLVTYRLAKLPLVESTRAALERVHLEAFDSPGDWVYRYLETLPAATCWLAEVDGVVVGFKMGACKGPRSYHSHEGAVSMSMRRRGVARGLMARQHQWAADQGYATITTNTFGRFNAMLRLNLDVGFDIVGTTMLHQQTRPKLHLCKRLDGTRGYGPEGPQASDDRCS